MKKQRDRDSHNKLLLRREAIAQLTGHELRSVRGGLTASIVSSRIPPIDGGS